MASTEGSMVRENAKHWAQLIRQCLAGVAEAWDTLCERAYPVVYEPLLSLTRDPDLAQDLAQETFLRLLKNGGEKLRTFDPARGTPFPAYLRVVAINVFRTWMAGSRDALSPSRPRHEIPPGMPARESATRDLQWRELSEMVERISPSARPCIMLHANGFSYKEISSIVGMTPGGVAAAISRGRTQLDGSGAAWVGNGGEG